MPQQENNRAIVFLIVIFLLWAFPDGSAVTPLGIHDTRESVIAREVQELSVLNNTRYIDFHAKAGRWLNITGLREDDGFAWDALEHMKGRVRGVVEHLWGEGDGGRIVGVGGDGVERDGMKGLDIPVWRNISGHARGRWVRSPLEKEIARPVLNMTELLPSDAHYFGARRFERNATGESGDLTVIFAEGSDLHEVEGVRVRRVTAKFTVYDETAAGEGWIMLLRGLQFVDTGHVVVTSTSRKFSGMWALPFLGLSEEMHRVLKNTTVERLERVIAKHKSMELMDLEPFDSATEGQHDNPYSPSCDVAAWVQQHPLRELRGDGKLVAPSSGVIGDMEDEIRYPEGSRPFSPPPMRMSAILFSPDCGFAIESKGPPDYPPAEGENHLTGEQWEIFIRTGTNWAIMFGVVLAAQVYLTILQMKHASTPSTRSRISVYTIGLMSLGDGYIGMAFLMLSLLMNEMAQALLATTFFAFLAVTFFDMRFLLEIWSIQSQERRRRERQEAAAAAASAPTNTEQPVAAAQQAPVISAAGADTLPLPVTTRAAITSGATPIMLPSSQDEDDTITAAAPQTDAARQRIEAGTLYGKFYLLLLTLTFLSVNAISWYPSLRGAFINTLAFIYCSLWVPQLHRNIMRNCRKALLYRFVIGQSILRLLPLAYFYLLEENVLWAKTDRRVFAVLVGWVWLQIWGLVVQDVLGPRVGVPREWLPPAYDYHPVLREDDEENLLPIGSSSAPASPVETHAHVPSQAKDKARDRLRRTFDCAICMQTIEVNIMPAGGSAGGATGSTGTEIMHNMVARRLYMLTPCRHIFHTKCLEAAMKFKLQCPVCREGLPPL